jgi:NADPH:quinone reductase
VRAVTTIGDNALAIRDHSDPKPGSGDVRVRVHGAGLNRADLLQRAGLYPAPPGSPPDIPGLEFAGVIDEVGTGVAERRVGEPVFGIAGGGGQAEFIVVPAEHCVPLPDSVDLVVMGGVPEAFVTAHDALVTQCRAQPGEWVLVHAAGSGVGTAAIQIAKALGCRVIGTARTAEKLERCRPLGLDVGVVASLDADGRLDHIALGDAVRAATGNGADVTLDLVGGDYVTADVFAAAPLGRISLIGTLAGSQASMPILAVMQKRLQLTGTVLRPRTRAHKTDATAAFARDLMPLIETAQIAPTVEAVLPLVAAEHGYDLLASNATFGKIVLDCR